MLDERFVIFGAALNIIGGASYIIDTLSGKTKPNKVTWAVWAAAPLLAFSAEIKQGVGLQSLMTFMVGFNPLLVFIASFFNKKSQWRIGKLDIICGFLAILGLVLWQMTRIGNLAIFFGILSDGLAGIPTIIKSYKAPETENYKVFLFSGTNALITMATIKVWNFAYYAFPAYIFSICLLLFLLIGFKLGPKIQKNRLTVTSS